MKLVDGFVFKREIDALAALAHSGDEFDEAGQRRDRADNRRQHQHLLGEKQCCIAAGSGIEHEVRIAGACCKNSSQDRGPELPVKMARNTMQVRQAKSEDVAAVMAVVRRVVPLMRAGGNLQWDDQYPNATVFERDVELAQLWVAQIDDKIDGQIAGVAAITTDQEPEYANVGWDISEPAIVVHRVAVDPAFRGQGVAAALMLQAETVARSRGIGVLRVDTNTQNAATQKLFPKLGYVLSGETELGFRVGLRFLCYEKRLR